MHLPPWMLPAAVVLLAWGIVGIFQKLSTNYISAESTVVWVIAGFLFALIWTGFIDGLGGWGRDLKDRYWGQVPIIAEGNWAYEDMKNQKTHGTPDENLDVALDWHANFAHFYFDHYAYSRVVKEDRAFLARGLEPGGLGYRLVPVSLTWPGTLPTRNMFIVKQTWVNRNVGQSYVQHHLRLNLIDAQNNRKLSEVDTGFDKTSWVAGETYDLTSVFHLPKV